MKLSMIVTAEDGTELMKKAIVVTRNQLKRISAPELHGDAIYKLKKNGRVEIKLLDSTIVYTLEGS